MDAMRKFYREGKLFPNPTRISRLYKMGLGDSKMAQYMVRAIARIMALCPWKWVEGGKDHAAIDGLDGNFDALKDIYMKVLQHKITPYDSPASLIGCYYHIHTNTECVVPGEKDDGEDKAGK